MTENNPPRPPSCELCADTGLLLADQSPGLSQDGPCICAQARTSATRQAEEQRQFKELIKTALREVMHEIVPDDGTP